MLKVNRVGALHAIKTSTSHKCISLLLHVLFDSPSLVSENFSEEVYGDALTKIKQIYRGTFFEAIN